MATAVLMAGGVGGVTSDDVTASKNQILRGAKTVTIESNDEIMEGTIPVQGYHGPNATECWYYPDQGGYVVRIEEGYYHREFGLTNFKPYVILPTNSAKVAAGFDAWKVLEDAVIFGERGKIKMINTQDDDYNKNKSWVFGLDGRGRFTIDFPHGNAYYHRPDGRPHVCIEAHLLGGARDSDLLEGATASSDKWIKFTGTIKHWICSTGDVISAHNGSGFVWDDTYGGRGRGIVVGIPEKHYIENAKWVFLPSPNIYPWNVRDGVNINGVVGTLKDFSTGREVFNGATFDGILVSGVANRGFYYNRDFYAYRYADDYSYSGIWGGGMNFNLTTGLNAIRGKWLGCVFSESINMTPFNSVVIDYQFVGHTSNRPIFDFRVYLGKAADIQRDSAIDDDGTRLNIFQTILGYGPSNGMLNGQITINTRTINEHVYVAFGAMCDVTNNNDQLWGQLRITKVTFNN